MYYDNQALRCGCVCATRGNCQRIGARGKRQAYLSTRDAALVCHIQNLGADQSLPLASQRCVLTLL